MTYWRLMISFVNLLQAPTASIYQLVKRVTFVLYLFDMVERVNKKKNCEQYVESKSKEQYKSFSRRQCFNMKDNQKES